MKLKARHLIALVPLAALIASCDVAQVSPDAPDALSQDAATRGKIVQWDGEVDESLILVKFASQPSEEMISSLKAKGATRVEPLFSMQTGNPVKKAEFGLDRWYEVYTDGADDLDRLVYSVAQMGEVSNVEYNVLAASPEIGEVYPAEQLPLTRGTSAQFNDPNLSAQWHYINNASPSVPNSVQGADINVKDVWSTLTCGDPSVIVAVVDWGVKYNHPDLAANMWTNTKEIPGNGIDDDKNGYIDDVYGYNFVENTGQINWANGHGTHCAGTIAAVNNNGRGVAGIAGGSGSKDGCRIMSCQMFSNASGSGSVRATAKAVEYAADNGASVISCSIGYDHSFESDDQYIRMQGSVEIDAIHYFESISNNGALTGNIAVFAAGNEGHNYAHYPGAFVDIISVSAIGPDYMPAPYTNYGPGCNIAAPGGNTSYGSAAGVLSTWPSELGSEYVFAQGTSMACPHMSGVVALGISYARQLNKKIDRDEFKRMILSSCQDLDQRIANAPDVKFAKYYHLVGTGLTDTWRLMMKIEGTPTSTVTNGKKQWVDLSDIFGTASVSLSYLKVDVPESTVSSLGLQKISGTTSGSYVPVPEGECYAYVQYGRLYIHPTKIGSGKLSVTAVGGGDHLGGGTNPPGGMELEQDMSIIVRDVDGGNGTGGWL